MSCRKALLELDRRKAIELPKINKRYSFQEVKEKPEPPSIMEVASELKELGEIEIKRVTTSKQSRVWRGMLLMRIIRY